MNVGAQARGVSAAYGIRWDDGKRVRLVAALVAALVTLAVLVGMSAAANGSMTSVVVAARPHSTDAAVRSVKALGGKVGARISLIHGFLARVPSDRLAELRAAKGVMSAAVDKAFSLSSTGTDDASPGASLSLVKQEIGATKLADAGVTGQDVDIAMIDSGVVPVPGLNRDDQVYVGPDFTPESKSSTTRGLDTFGHGTHLAGIMVGDNHADGFEGVAPDARLVSVKAADHLGDSSLGQLLLAMSWVVGHRHDYGLNIRVLNLSVGAPLTGNYTADPLAYAVEQAWKAGIVVVAAAGNGNDSPQLDTPAADPFVLAVGAANQGTTPDVADDSIPSWSRAGTADRGPDVVAPGASIVSLRDPGSYIDQQHPEGLVGTAYFKGSGTSQAAAVVSGSVALLLQENPNLTPDQVKELLKRGANGVPGGGTAQGAGVVDANDSAQLPVPAVRQQFPVATIQSILSADRSHDVAVNPAGMANSWSANSWSSNSWSANSWSTASWGDSSGS